MQRWFAGFAALLISAAALAFSGADLPTVSRQSLPAQAQETLRLIEAGGPFPYSRDGIVFKNYERLLPPQPRGFYREYTVPTPGLTHRGPRRLVCGGNPRRPPPTCYYTSDHYKSFQRIQQ